jgi:glycosyltransferase involved in cell wall biosynthesis
MKILIISKNIDRTAPGIVIEKLIQGLSKFHYVDVLTSVYDPSFTFSAIKNVYEIKEKPIHPRIFKFIVSIFGCNPLDWWWARKAIHKLKINDSERYDLIFSILSLHHYTPLIAGVQIKKKFSAKFAVHTLDAIPAPIEWPENRPYFKSVKKMMARYLPASDFFFSTNEQMLQYQLSTFTAKNNIVTEVIYNPTYANLEHYYYDTGGSNRFLYTGGIYGLRNPKYILGAFKKLLKEYPDSTLEFVGSSIAAQNLSIFSFDEREKVIVHPFTRDLTKYYEGATALIDIDADLPNDVFLSSKIINYITINRMIICETGNNSPSKEIFKEIPSILQCDHNVDELFTAMKRAIELKSKVNFSDRGKVIALFNLDSVIEKLNNKINCIAQNKIDTK